MPRERPIYSQFGLSSFEWFLGSLFKVVAELAERSNGAYNIETGQNGMSPLASLTIVQWLLMFHIWGPRTWN